MIWTALIFGLLGSFHCVGMCGPIAFMLPLNRKSRNKRVLQLISYHAGRLFTYSFLGFIIGLVGKSLNLFEFQQQISIIIGLAMIAMILIPSKILNTYKISKPIYTAVSKIKSALGSQLKKRDPGTFFTLGFLNGLLPCGLVYMAIFGSVAVGGVTNGILYMLMFGLGTIPLMTTAVYLGNFLKGKARKRIVKIIPVFVVFVGMLFVLRGMGLGIKYISPSNMVAVEKADSKYNCH